MRIICRKDPSYLCEFKHAYNVDWFRSTVPQHFVYHSLGERKRARMPVKLLFILRKIIVAVPELLNMNQPIEVRRTWRSVCKWHFQMHYFNENSSHLIQIALNNVLKDQFTTSQNCLSPSRKKTITWTKVNKFNGACMSHAASMSQTSCL